LDPKELQQIELRRKREEATNSNPDSTDKNNNG